MKNHRKPVVYTQRVDVVESYQERRDCADQNIPKFIQVCGYLPVPVPNVLDHPEDFLDCIKPVGIMLTGGNSLVKYGGAAPERDATDLALIRAALQRNIPLYGFCRGMQSILDYFGYELITVKGHVAVRHIVDGSWGKMEVNSYHNQACLQAGGPLQVMAAREDGVIEAVASAEKRVIATMWHPERESHFAQSDIERVQRLFG